MIPKRIKSALVHLCFIAVYVANEVNVTLHMGSGAGFWDFTLFYIADIFLFYGLTYGILPLFNRGRWHIVAGVILIPCCWAGFLGLYNVINETLNLIYPDRPPIHFKEPNYYSSFYRSVFITILATAFHLGRRNVAHVKEKLRLMNVVLQAQINPHFIFNNLSTIYTQIDREPEKAKQALLLLSDILRYNLREIGVDGLVTLVDEVEQVRRYIHLKHLNNAELNIRLETDIPETVICSVPSLLLVTLVENMFKHGWLEDPDRPAVVQVSWKNGVIHFHTDNEIRADEDTAGYQIGLENSRARLQTNYRNRYTLLTRIAGDRFILDLTIKP